MSSVEGMSQASSQLVRQRVSGLGKWDLSEVAAAQQTATISVFVPYPGITAELVAIAPKARKEWITQKMQRDRDAVLASGLLTNEKLLKSPGQRKRNYGGQGDVRVAGLPALAELASVESIQVESTNGRPLKPARLRRGKSFYCVKMTVAIQIEGYERGLQSCEERYVLLKAYTEAEARSKAQGAASEYGKPYLNSDGLLVRWKVESIDDVYEVMFNHDASGRPCWDGTEVFSRFKTRKITAARAWLNAND